MTDALRKAKAAETEDEMEHRLCGEFWTWLYDARQADCGREPSDEAKVAHPSFTALRELRAKPVRLTERAKEGR